MHAAGTYSLLREGVTRRVCLRVLRLMPLSLVVLMVVELSSTEARCAVTENSLSLTWNGPVECPTQPEVVASIERLLAGYQPYDFHLVADAKIVNRGAAGYLLTIQTSINGMRGERRLEGHSCVAVTDAAIVALALLLNPHSSFVDMSATEPASHREAPLQRIVRHSAQAEPHHSLVWNATSYVGGHFGILPHAGAELGMGLGVTWGRVSLLIQGAYEPPQRKLLDDQKGMGGRHWVASASTLGCWSARQKSPRLGACLGTEFYRMEGLGVGVSVPQHGVIVWTSVALGGFIETRLYSKLALRMSAFGLAPLSRPTTYLEGIGSVHRPDALGAKAQIGVVVDWP